MHKLFLLAPILAFLVGNTCEKSDPPSDPPPPPPNASPYCYGEPSLTRKIEDGVSAVYQAIMGGEPSTDRRATLQMRMTNGLCTGVAIDAYTALTAAHCTVDSYDTTAVIGTEPGMFVAKTTTNHPEYVLYDNQMGGDPHSDIALLKFDDPLPGPYMTKVFDPENPAHASQCLGFVASGWGRWEGSELSLRETEYDVDRVSQKLVTTFNEPGEGRICFGDSGGPLYAEMANGELWLVGLARTTGSLDCTIASTHVRSSHFETWVNANK